MNINIYNARDMAAVAAASYNISVSMEGNKRHHYHQQGIFSFKIEQNENGTFVASLYQNGRHPKPQDDVGALYYVVAVILIYGCSILMMIASYIRKNKVDRRLNRYLKEMANVRKRERRMTLMSTAAKMAKKEAATIIRQLGSNSCSAQCSANPSPNLTPSGRGSPNILSGAVGETSAGGFPRRTPSFLGVGSLLWPGTAAAAAAANNKQISGSSSSASKRPNSPLLIVCDHSDYDSDSEANHSDRSADYQRQQCGRFNRRSVKLCVPLELQPLKSGGSVHHELSAADRKSRLSSDPSLSSDGKPPWTANRKDSAQQQDSLNSSDCRSDDENSSSYQKFDWPPGAQVVSSV